MTNEDAIIILTLYRAKIANSVSIGIEEDVKAYDMAIKALKKADGDLISRDYVLSKFKEQCDRCGKYKENNGVMCRCCALDDAIDYVEDAPSAESEEEE